MSVLIIVFAYHLRNETSIGGRRCIRDGGTIKPPIIMVQSTQNYVLHSMPKHSNITVVYIPIERSETLFYSKVIKVIYILHCRYILWCYILIGIELFMPDSLISYKVAAVYHIDTTDTVLRSRLIKLRQDDVSVIILHHYDLDKTLHIFKMVLQMPSVVIIAWILMCL